MAIRPYTLWKSLSKGEYGGIRPRSSGDRTVGSQVQIFNQSGVLCGEFTVYGHGMPCPYGMMMVYGDDADTPEVDGARLGEQLIFYVNGEAAETEEDIYWLGDKAVQRVDIAYRSRPEVSMLRQNYPNPFNPDTWIPYQLSEDAEVVIKIYTSTGQLVRTLSLGHKPAGFYTGKEKAAYWDGCNEAGESIASGIYFYSIEAGGYNATRKMAVVR